ncbi:MAG: peptidylprolyl isomerase [Halieaceae bacterium]|nr:peptidylprolyl isomerase [Halieaceae bacterium]
MNRPWLHFLALGAILFLLLRWLNPPPLPVVGPLSAARVETLQNQWFSFTGRKADPPQLERMVRAELDRDMLFQEALRLELHLYDRVVQQRLIRNMRFLRLGEGKSDQELYRQALRMELHMGDEVVKRRLIQVMEQLLTAANGISAPTEEEIQQRFEERTEQLRRPTRYSFEHVFLSRERAGQADAVMKQIKAEKWTAQQARQLSSPFLPGYRFRALSPQQVARHFGAEFASGLEKMQPQPSSWLGPIDSTYGLHLVWVDAVEPARDARLDEVRVQLARDLLRENRRQALQDATARLRQRYEVLL